MRVAVHDMEATREDAMSKEERFVKTTHVGSLPRLEDMIALLDSKDHGQPYDDAALQSQVRKSVSDVVTRQTKIGIDIVNDGEHGRSNFAAYARQRIGGLENTFGGFLQRAAVSRDALEFPDVYAEAERMYPSRYKAGRPRQRIPYASCTGPITYIGQAEVKRDIDNLRSALDGKDASDAFITAISPSNLELYFKNEYYKTEEEYLEALANAMHEEYRAIVEAGFIVQIDDPRLATHYDRHPSSSIEDCRKFMGRRIETVNHAIRGLPQDRVRFHTCYSINVAPRVHDMELKDYVDLMLQIRASGYSFEAANPRHEHEWKVWEDVKLPDGKALLPGVVSHCVHIVEHPELVAQRILRFCDVVGAERVIASNDCGFATSGAADEVHPDVAWAKLDALVRGAQLANAALARR